MKKIVILLILTAGIFTYTSCSEETVNLEPIGYTEAGFFQGESDFQWAINGLYHKLANFYAFQGDPNNTLIAISLLPSDDLTTRANYGEENFVAMQGGSGRVSRFYNNCYQMLQRTNTLLDYIEERGDAAYVTAGLKDLHTGEALFFRGWTQFMLWNVFGTAPVITKRIKELNGDEYPPNSTGTELLDQAISDLQQAAELLPATWTGTNVGRVTKNSAYGLRGKALMFRGTVTKNTADFTAALTDFNAIAGRSLVRNYNWNFDYNYENNSESLFEYQANSSLGNVNPFLQSDDFAVIGELGAYWGCFSVRPTWVNERFYVGTTSLYNLYNPQDPRRDYNYTKNPKFDGTAANVTKYVLRPTTSGGLPPTTGFAQGNNGANNGIYVNNPRILRLADVMLLKAEAIVRTNGNLSEAIGIINEIRARARKSTDELPSTPPGDIIESVEPADRATGETDPQTVLEWVFEERRLELAFEEGHRWWDLRRRHLAGEIDLKTIDFSSISTGIEFNDYNINYPLPNNEVIENPNLTQNPGY
jgi:starch-binding outer membrane protein, SusD/RagB family